MITALHQPRLAYHVLRLSVAGMMLMHGIAKLVKGVGGIENLLAARGLPEELAYGVYLGEVVAPVLVIANIWVQISALTMVVVMVFAIGLAHAGEIFTLRSTGAWGIELQALFLFGSLAVALLARPGRRG
jgi:putative oxidoreductase